METDFLIYWQKGIVLATLHACADCNRSHCSHIFIAVIILKHRADYARLAEARKTLFTRGESNELEWL